MYSLTFRVHVTTPSQYGRNGMAHAAGASILSQAEGVFAGMHSAWHCVGVWWAWRMTAGLCHAFPYCCHSNATRATIANPPNSAQLGGIPYHSAKLHPGPCNSVGMQPRTDRHTDTQTDTQMRVTTIHFSWSTSQQVQSKERAGSIQPEAFEFPIFFTMPSCTGDTIEHNEQLVVLFAQQLHLSVC